MDVPDARGSLRATLALPAALAVVSAAALVVEIAAGRLLAPYVGMSLYTWTAIIAVVLAGLSAGHWLGGVVDPADDRRSYRILAAALALAAVTTALVPALETMRAQIQLLTDKVEHLEQAEAPEDEDGAPHSRSAESA